MPNTFLVPDAQEAAAQAYQKGFNDGYSLAAMQDDLELGQIKKEESLCISQQQTN